MKPKKHLLRKIFFWDEPAKGAFLHSTLALAVPWCLSSLLSFMMPIVLMHEPDSSFGQAIVWPVLAMFLGMPIVAVFETIATILCLVRWFSMRGGDRQNKTPRNRIDLCLGFLVAVCWISAIIVLLIHGKNWTPHIVSAFALTLIGYGFFGIFLSRQQKVVIGKGVLRAWGVVAALWLVSFVLANVTKSAAERHCIELERRFGRQPTNEARDEWLAQDCHLDSAFWQKAQDLLQMRPKPNGDFDSQEMIVHDILGVNPSNARSPDELACYRKQLADFAELPVLEEMFSGAIPFVSMADFESLEVADTIVKFARLEQWRLHFALKDKEMENVEAILGRLDKLLACWTEMQKHGFLIGGWALQRLYCRQVEYIINSSLPTDELLHRMKRNLQEKEAEYRSALDGISFSSAVFFNNEFQSCDESFWAGEPTPAIYLLFFFLRTLDCFHWEKPSWRRRLQIIVGRCLFPQFWFLEANEMRIVFSFLGMDSLEIPDDCSGSIMVAMYHEFLSNPSYGYRLALTNCRVLQCMIDAVLEYRRTGEYPESLPSVPEDPFTGEPLKYRVGDCWVFDYDNRKASKVQAIQIWSCGWNKRDDDGANFRLPDDWQRKIDSRDDIRILLPLKQREQ